MTTVPTTARRPLDPAIRARLVARHRAALAVIDQLEAQAARRPLTADETRELDLAIDEAVTVAHALENLHRPMETR